MDLAPEPAEARASREASAWSILLQEQPDDAALRRRFAAWRNASAENAQAWMAVEHLSQVAASLQPELAAEWEPSLASHRAAGRTMHERAAMSPARRPGRWSMSRKRLAAAAVALAACVAFVVGPSLILRLQSDAVTDTAEIRQLELPDGSRITLAAGSALTLSFAADIRRVDLLKGEAFFRVAPNASRPFRVRTGDVETTVVGTRFDVRRDPTGVAVSVEEGVVEVGAVATEGSAIQTLGPGDAVHVSWQGRAVRSSVSPQLVAAWRHGQLILQDVPLQDAVAQLRPYYGGGIVVADDVLAGKPITGAYNLNDPEDALRGMARAHGAVVRRITPWLIVLSSS